MKKDLNYLLTYLPTNLFTKNPSPQPSPARGEGVKVLFAKQTVKNLSPITHSPVHLSTKVTHSLTLPLTNDYQSFVRQSPKGRGKKAAFTLAETLITLGIIGVVAAMTLSALVTNIINRGFVEKFKKAYSSLQQATLLIEQETGISAKDFQIAGNNTIGHQNIINMYGLYAKHLNTVKKIEIPEQENFVGEFRGDTEIKKIYKNLKCKYLNGGIDTNCTYVMNLSGFPFPPLQDGTIIVLKPHAQGAGAYDWGISELNSKAAFTIDVNGPQKPNQLGRDIFRVYLHNSGKIYAPNNHIDNAGTYGPDCVPKAEGTSGRGYSCAYRILTEGKMNY